MKNSLKGAFLSGVVFPGLGQVVLGYRLRGFAFMFVVLASLILIVAIATQQAFTILENIEAGAPIDYNTISNAATQGINTADSFIINLFTLLMLFCWLFGVVDAYILGKKKDSEVQTTSQNKQQRGAIP